MKKIKPGDIFFAKNRCFLYKDIVDNSDLQNDGEEYKYPFLFNAECNYAISVADDMIFCFKYLGGGRVKELSTKMEFYVESDLTSDMKWYSSFYGDESHTINGMYVDRYNESADEYDLISPKDYNTIFDTFVCEARFLPVHIRLNEEDIIEINEESTNEYLKVSDEERVCLIRYYIAYARRSFKDAFNKLYDNVNNQKDIDDFGRRLSNFKKGN